MKMKYSSRVVALAASALAAAPVSQAAVHLTFGRTGSEIRMNTGKALAGEPTRKTV
jgi:hypothetical protein